MSGKNIVYPNHPSASRSVAHESDVPGRPPPENPIDIHLSSESEGRNSYDDEYFNSSESKEP